MLIKISTWLYFNYYNYCDVCIHEFFDALVKSHVLVFFFQKMKSCMVEAESLQPVYTKMADSIK